MKKIRIAIVRSLGVLGILYLTSGNMHAAIHEGSSDCDNNIGTVLTVDNDELFTIKTCGGTRTYTEFSYCYEVEEGDTVVFDWDPQNCEFVGFTVLHNGVQCGVWCP
jgi:hypothetical protein